MSKWGKFWRITGEIVKTVLTLFWFISRCVTISEADGIGTYEISMLFCSSWACLYPVFLIETFSEHRFRLTKWLFSIPRRWLMEKPVWKRILWIVGLWFVIGIVGITLIETLG